MTLTGRRLLAALVLAYVLGALSGGCGAALVMGETRTVTLKGFGVELQIERKLEAGPEVLAALPEIDPEAIEAKAEEAGL